MLPYALLFFALLAQLTLLTLFPPKQCLGHGAGVLTCFSETCHVFAFNNSTQHSVDDMAATDDRAATEHSILSRTATAHASETAV